MRAKFLPHISSFLTVVVTTLALSLSFTFCTPAKAQTLPQPPADIQKIYSDIGDLDLLKAIIPLRLTAPQIEKLQVPLKEIAESNTARLKTDHEALRGIGADMAKAREAALAGETVTTDTENKVLRVLNAADDRFTKAKQEAVTKVMAVVKESFTSDQKDEVERQVGKMLGGKRLVPKEYRNDPKKAPKEAVQDLALQLFVERILIADRMSGLLAQIKPVPADSKETTTETKPADGGATKPAP